MPELDRLTYNIRIGGFTQVKDDRDWHEVAADLNTMKVEDVVKKYGIHLRIALNGHPI